MTEMRPARPLLITEDPGPCRSGAQAHHVTDEEAFRSARVGVARAFCGRHIRPACLVAPVGRLCPECAAARCVPDGLAAVARRRARRRALSLLLRIRT